MGLSKRELELLGDVTHSKPIKTSRRDFGYVLSRRLNGGTTVAGTVAICKAVGITVFATGGICITSFEHAVYYSIISGITAV